MRKCNARHNLLALSLLLALVGAGLLLLPACRREAIPEPKVLKWALGTAWPEAEDFYPDLAEGASVTFASDNPFPNNEKTMMTKSYETTLVYRTAGGRSAKKTATVDVTVDKEPPVISGVRVIAVSVGEAVAYRDGVTVTDDCDGTIELTVDDSQVDLETVGEYLITYTATDRTGKKTTVESKVNVYDKEWTAKSGSNSFTMKAFNNYEWNGWTFIRCGRKAAASKASIATDTPVAAKVAKVLLRLDSVSAADVNSMKLSVCSDKGFSKEICTVGPDGAIAPGEVSFAVPAASQAAGLYYKLTFDCKMSSVAKNGFVQISKVIYVAAE